MRKHFCSEDCRQYYIEGVVDYGIEMIKEFYNYPEGNCRHCNSPLSMAPVVWILAQAKVPMSYFGFSAWPTVTLGNTLIVAVRRHDANWQLSRLASGMQVQSMNVYDTCKEAMDTAHMLNSSSFSRAA